MLRRYLSLSVAVLIGMAMTTSLAGSTSAAVPHPNAGPSCAFKTELVDGGAVPLKDAAIINRTNCGYRYRAGQQNSNLEITLVQGGLRFADTRTARFDKLAPGCRKIRHVRVGVIAVCKVPDGYSADRPLLIEVWPRLGDDIVDGSSLSGTFSMAVLGDAGNDVARLGAGPDFFNGASGHDQVWGGGGNDWLRTGDNRDHIWGGKGNDYLLGVDGPDTINGGAGADQIFCGNNVDRATVDGDDTKLWLCEQLNHS